jgi:hypothetical protein
MILPPPPLPPITDREIAERVAAIGLPDGWSRADDLAMMEGLFMGLGLGRIGAQIGKPLEAMQGRFLALRAAATDGAPGFTLTTQTALLHAVRGLA